MVKQNLLAAMTGGCLTLRETARCLSQKNIVEKRAYNTKSKIITWEKCTLRAYLNGEFYNKFNDLEKRLILDTTVFNNENPEFGTGGGNNTADKIFLLSIDEANRYFCRDSERIATYQDSVRWWWLRSPGIKNHAAGLYPATASSMSTASVSIMPTVAFALLCI